MAQKEFKHSSNAIIPVSFHFFSIQIPWQSTCRDWDSKAPNLAKYLGKLSKCCSVSSRHLRIYPRATHWDMSSLNLLWCFNSSKVYSWKLWLNHRITRSTLQTDQMQSDSPLRKMFSQDISYICSDLAKSVFYTIFRCHWDQSLPKLKKCNLFSEKRRTFP